MDALGYEAEISRLKRTLELRDKYIDSVKKENMDLREQAEEYRKRAADARADFLIAGISGKIMSGSDAYKKKAAECEHWKQAYIELVHLFFAKEGQEL